MKHDGRTYVPVRYMAESLDAVVIYDEAKKTIRVDDRFDAISFVGGVKAGHLKVVKDGNKSKVTGELYAGQRYFDSLYERMMAAEDPNKVELNAHLAFYDDSSKLLGKVAIKVPFTTKGDQLKEIEAITEQDVTGYSFATLENVWPVPHDSFLPPDLHVKDKSGLLGVGYMETIKSGEYTKVRFPMGVFKEGNYRIEAVVTYYDEQGKVLGTAEINTLSEGPVDVPSGEQINIVDYETAGKGDFTKAARYTLDVISSKLVAEK
nr:stalk domain-containing protein [Paenibacillus sp. GSMTC-2017]